MSRRMVFVVCISMCLLWLGYQYVPTQVPKVIASWPNYHPFPEVSDMSTHLTEEWTKETMAIRGRTLRERCGKTQGNTQGIPLRTHRYMYVDDDHKFLICVNNKVGSSNIVRILLVLNGVTHKSNPNDISVEDIRKYHRRIKRLSQFTNSEKTYILRNYKKYTFVREPFERLISAYNSKFKTGNEPAFRRRKAHVIFDTIKPNGNSSYWKGYNVSFSEFVQFILHPNTIKRGYDPHWATYSSTCNPCSIRYDSVGKLETFNKDMEVLLGEIRETGVPVPQMNAHPNKSIALLEQYYKDISSENIKKLKNVYAYDSFLFDYEFPCVLRTLLNKA